MHFPVLIAITALLCVQARENICSRVNVEVFYESYCPDSKRFVLEQLHPAYNELSIIMNLQLIPYGRASRRWDPSKKQYNFSCEHGEKECLGNLFQGCAFHHYPNPGVHLPFLACMFNSSSPNKAYLKCVKKCGFNLGVLAKCNNGPEGNKLQARYAEWSESVNPEKRLSFVPWIRMDRKDKMYDAYRDFKNTLYEVCAKKTKTPFYT